MITAKNTSKIPVFILGAVLVLFLAGCATTAPPVKTECKAKIEWQIAPEGEISEFKCEMGTYEKEAAVIITAGVKNISDKPLRYRLNVFLLDMDKAAGSLIPAKGKPPVLEPGKAITVKLPFPKTDNLSKEILVVLKTIEL